MRGVWAPVVTPLGADGAPDHGRYTEHVATVLEAGCHGVVLFGTTGEAPSFSVAERQAATAAVVRSGVDPERLVVGAGRCALPETNALIRHALDLGVTRMLVVPPFFFTPLRDDAVVAVMAEIIDRVEDDRLAVMLYHFPRYSSVPFSIDVVGELTSRYPDTIIGIKDSSGDPVTTTAFVEAFPDLAIMPGNEVLLLDMLRLGGAGTITAGANVHATEIRRVYDAFHDGRLDEAAELQRWITEARSVLNQYGSILAIKALLGVSDPAWRSVRLPWLGDAVPDGAAVQAGIAEVAPLSV